MNDTRIIEQASRSDIAQSSVAEAPGGVALVSLNNWFQMSAVLALRINAHRSVI
jgi:hypothetical protein